MKIKEIHVKRFYEKKLRKKAWLVIKKNWDQVREERLTVKRAENFNALWVKKRCFSEWTDRLEARNEMKCMHVVYKARRHNETRLKQVYLRQWVEFRIEQRRENVITLKKIL